MLRNVNSLERSTLGRRASRPRAASKAARNSRADDLATSWPRGWDVWLRRRSFLRSVDASRTQAFINECVRAYYPCIPEWVHVYVRALTRVQSGIRRRYGARLLSLPDSLAAWRPTGYAAVSSPRHPLRFLTLRLIASLSFSSSLALISFVRARGSLFPFCVYRLRWHRLREDAEFSEGNHQVFFIYIFFLL